MLHRIREHPGNRIDESKEFESHPCVAGNPMHGARAQVRQRVHAVALGYGDLKDQGQSDENSAVAAMEGGTVARSCIDKAVWTTA